MRVRPGDPCVFLETEAKHRDRIEAWIKAKGVAAIISFLRDERIRVAIRLSRRVKLKERITLEKYFRRELNLPSKGVN